MSRAQGAANRALLAVLPTTYNLVGERSRCGTGMKLRPHSLTSDMSLEIHLTGGAALGLKLSLVSYGKGRSVK